MSETSPERWRHRRDLQHSQTGELPMQYDYNGDGVTGLWTMFRLSLDGVNGLSRCERGL
ncbi:MAG: hypothetical protein ACLU9S_19595 [Oscillospiraceae bacterium]